MREGKTLSAGTKLDGKYEIIRLLGQGGAGQVYLATHLWTKREVAIKVLAQSASEDAEMANRFLREARATTKLEHPNIVSVLDMGEDPVHGVYLVMERLQGETLEQRLERSGKLPHDEALELLIPVIDGLRVAHDLGIVHRDLKPANLFIAATTKGTAHPKVLDFGIAKIIADAKFTTITTEAGMVMGTPYYMSPEQIDGRAKATDHRTDIWSMGVVLYECITGRRPFEGEYLSHVVTAIAGGHYMLLADRPEGAEDPAVAATVDKCLQYEPADRIQTMGELMEALRASSSGLKASVRSLAPGATRVPVASPAPSLARVRLPGSSPFTQKRLLAITTVVLLAAAAAIAYFAAVPETPGPRMEAAKATAKSMAAATTQPDAAPQPIPSAAGAALDAGVNDEAAAVETEAKSPTQEFNPRDGSPAKQRHRTKAKPKGVPDPAYDF